MANEGRDPSLPAVPVCVCRHPYCRLWRSRVKVAKGNDAIRGPESHTTL